MLTLFPELVEQYFRTSIMARAVNRGLITPRVVDIREHARDRHRSCDDAPYGGGPGMVLLGEPIRSALEAAGAASARVVYPCPTGRPFVQADACRLAAESELVVLCGRYEGIDQRIIDRFVDDEVSIGDYVLSSGELAGMVLVDAVFRLRADVIRHESVEEESFSGSLLEYPHFTRPETLDGDRVPAPLLTGNHARIAQWRKDRRIQRTVARRPDLSAGVELSPRDRVIAWNWLSEERQDERNTDH